PQKLALAAAEAVGLAARCQENAEDIAFHEQRSGDERGQPRGRQPLRKREVYFIQVGFIDERATNTARQAVSVNFDTAVFVQVQRGWNLLTARTQAGDREVTVRRFVGADATQIR